MGEPPQNAQPASSVEPATNAYVPTDLTCRQCGYNLYTLALVGVCPECGCPVEHSLRGFLLKYAAPEWIRRVARGSLLLVIAVALMALASAGVGAWAAIRALSQGAGRGLAPSIDMRGTTFVSALIFAPLTALAIVAVVSFTTRNPADTLPGADSAARLWLRRSLWLYAGQALLGWLSLIVPEAAMSVGTRSALTALTLPLGTAVLTLAAALGLRYIGQLAARVPRPGLVRFATVCYWGVLICGILTTLGYTALAGTMAQSITAVSSTSPASAPGTGPVGPIRPALPAAGLTAIVTGCPACVAAGFYVASFVLLIMACTALFKAAREAEQNALVA
jgi:hypothetical protein